MARVKHVVPTDEVPHLWFHQTQSDARNQQGNLYFEGASIWSYGSHFCIAKLVENKKGQPGVLFTTRSWGPTTGKHLNAVRRAIPDDVPVFKVHNPNDFEHSLVRRFKAKVDDAKLAIKSAKSKPSRAKLLDRLISAIENANAYLKWAGLHERMKMPVGYSVWVQEKVEWDRAVEARREVQREKYREAYERSYREEAKRRAERAAKMPELIEAWKRGENPPALQGYGMYNLPCMLRIVGSEIQTSLGARVPLDHARKALPLVLRVFETGNPFIPNGKTIRLGFYEVSRITPDGIKVGCHHIPRQEIERIAPLIRESKP